jgi:hypothetical protein
MPNGSALFEKIEELLEDCGELSLRQRDQILLAAMRDLHREILEIDRKVDELVALKERVVKLEEKSILMLIEKHPKAASFIIGIILLLVNLWFISDYRRAILKLLGLPTELAP